MLKDLLGVFGGWGAVAQALADTLIPVPGTNCKISEKNLKPTEVRDLEGKYIWSKLHSELKFTDYFCCGTPCPQYGGNALV